MKKKRWILPVAIIGGILVTVLSAVLLFGGLSSNKGYGISTGRLYFADFGTYLIDDNDSAMHIADRTKKKDLFEGYENGDRVIVLHGPVAESYPAETVGFAVFRIGKGEDGYKPSDETLGIYILGDEGAILSGKKVNFKAQYIRTGLNGEEEFPLCKVIHSVAELNDYFNQNKDKYYLDTRRQNPASDSTIGFLDAIDKYDEDYFSEQILIMVLVEEPSVSIRHKVNYVKDGSDGRIYIDVHRTVPEAGTDDMAEWHILIEPEKGVSVESEADVKVLIDGIDPKRSPKPITVGKNVANLSIQVIDGFEYAVYDGESDNSFYVEIWPWGRSEEKLKVGFDEKFAVCGTLLETEEIRLAGYDAVKGTYSGDKMWYFITLKGVAGTYYIQNNGAENWWDLYEAEAMRMLSTLRVAEGIIREDDAIAIAKGVATVEYDTVSAEYDAFNGIWTVHFFKENTAGGDELVRITHQGKVITSEYGE